MSDEEDPMLKRIRALLANAEDPNLAEAARDAYMEKAEALIAKYGIDQALLANAGMARDEVGERFIMCDAPYASAKRRLLVSICQPLRVRTVRRRHGNGERVHLFGYRSDLERVEILYTSLLVQAATGMARVRPSEGMTVWQEGFYTSGRWVTRPPSASQVAAFRRDWMQGFGDKVYWRLKEAEERAKQQAEPLRPGVSTDLVLVDRNAAVNKAVELAYPKLGSARDRTVRDGDAYQAGARAGATADLGGTRVEQGARDSISN